VCNLTATLAGRRSAAPVGWKRRLKHRCFHDCPLLSGVPEAAKLGGLLRAPSHFLHNTESLFVAEKAAKFPLITGSDKLRSSRCVDDEKLHSAVEGSASPEKTPFDNSGSPTGVKFNGQTVKIALQKSEEKDGKPTKNPNAEQNEPIRVNIPKLVQYEKLGEHREYHKGDRPLPQAERV
jgi:hypothetical protein